MFVVIATSLIPGLAACIALFVWRTRTSLERREAFSCKPLGVHFRGRRVRPHSVLALADIRSLDDYIKKTDSRSVKTTMKGQIDRVFRETGVEVATNVTTSAAWEHFRVIFEHESRLLSKPKAFLVTLIRFLCVYVMVGTLDEYRKQGKLVAFSCSIVKGKTLRAMWFYQRTEYSQCMIWFHTARLSLLRALAMGLQHVDLGPSEPCALLTLCLIFCHSCIVRYSDIL